MNRLMKKEVKKLLVGLLALTIALGPITPTITQANTLKQNDDSTSISQRLTDNEMKEIVGGGSVVNWIFGGGIIYWISSLWNKEAPYTLNFREL